MSHTNAQVTDDVESLSVTALRTDERGQDVIDLIFRILGRRRHRMLPKSRSDRATGANQVGFDMSSPEWLTILYPAGFLDGYGCTQTLSAEFECLAFDFEVYAGQCWWYNLFEAGELIDLFWQQPRYFEGRHEAEPQLADEAFEARKGDPALVAERVGIPAGLIEPYYAQLDDVAFRSQIHSEPEAYEALLAEARKRLMRKAHPEDAYTLHDPMSFTDFAQKLGIHYPSTLETQPELVFYGLKPHSNLK